MSPGPSRATTPPIRYVRTDDGVGLAYSVSGEGSRVMVKVGMWLTHLEFDATNPLMRHWLDAMGSRGRYVRHDARGCGLSDADPSEISFERWVDDLEVVARTVTGEPVTVLGFSQGAAVAIDVSELLPQVRCPTLVLHSKDDVRVPFAEGRLIATAIPGAELVPLDGVNHALMSDEPGWQQALAAIDHFLPPRPPRSSSLGLGRLTARQSEILELVAQGCSNAEIAARLHLSEKTVRNQVSAIFDQLGVNSRGQAIVRAREAGFGRNRSADR
jgi:DNA-binding CsgD family transcriptional regulator/pimeloyl-ACP methyl ester carboxylesterase